MRLKRLWNRENFLILCWALYDTSNQFFVLNVVSIYFPRWLTGVKNVSAFYYSLAFGGSMILVGILSPLLGTISDVQRHKRHYLVIFTLISVTFTFFMGMTGNAAGALVFFLVANFGCQMANVFYNALLPNVVGRKKIGMASGIGRMFGYSGALLALLLSKPLIEQRGYQPVMMATAVAFFVFALPAMIFIKEKDCDRDKPLISFFNKEKIKPVLERIAGTWRNGTRFREIRLFLLMFFWGMCAYQTVVLFLAVYVGEVYKLSEAMIINLIFFSTLFAIAGSFVSGFLGDKFGHKRVMRIVFGLWVLAFIAGAFARPPLHWIVGPIIGLTLSATGVVGRAWVVHLIPREEIGEVFGLYNLVGYAAGIVGPLFWGIILLIFSPLGVWRYRLSLLSMVVFIALAYSVFRKIPE